MVILTLIFTFFSSMNESWGSQYENYAKCINPHNGRIVPVKNTMGFDNIGYAYTNRNGAAAIIWYPQVAQRMSPILATFFAFHECGHIRMSHSLKPYKHPKAKEQQADCYAIKVMIKNGLMNEAILNQLQYELKILQPFDTMTHFSGAKRAQNLRGCFN